MRNKEEIRSFLENDLKIDKRFFHEGTENGIPFLYVGLSEGKKKTIEKLIKYGFKFQVRYLVNHESSYQYHKEYRIEITKD